MSGIGTSYQDGALDDVIAGFPSTMYATYSDTEVELDGTGLNEPDTADGFDRVSLNNSTDWDPASGGIKPVNKKLDFPDPTDTWSGPQYWALMDSATVGAGNVVLTGKFGGATKAPESGDDVYIPANVIFIRYREDAV